ncbi:hypothetical protein JCM3775_001350 [Rhodotorula graminis]
MSSPPASSAAGHRHEQGDPLFRQTRAVYSFFKDPVGVSLHRKHFTSEELARHNAASLNQRAVRGSNSALQSWDQMSQTQHELLVELLLKYYCESRAKPENNEWPLGKEIDYRTIAQARKSQLPAHVPDPFQRLNMLLSLLTTLYNSPIDEREFEAFEDMRHVIGEARRQVTKARSTNPLRVPFAQHAFDAAEERLDDRLETANAAREVRLQQVKAAMSLLHDKAALLPDWSNVAHHAAVEVYFSHLDYKQQAAVVAQVREFVFAACEERALAEILNALRAHHLGHTLCAVRLASIVDCLELQDAPSHVVEHFQAAHHQFCSVECTDLFSHLALTQQVYAVSKLRDLLRRIQTEPFEAEQVVDELAAILPMYSEDSSSWKHAPKVDDPPAFLHSLAHSASTRHAPFGADSTSSATSSRYFPQARSARW